MIAKGKTGRGFKGAAQYLLHDKGADTARRVAWTHAENLRSDSPARAWREMIWTAARAADLKRESGQRQCGRKAEKPVYHLSLSWAKDEAPSREEMIAAGKDALKGIGLDGHQALFVCHNDEPQPHLHLLVNRVDRENGLMSPLSRSRRKLSAWAMKYEFARGQIRCPKRVENNRALQQGERPRHKDAAIRAAWERSDSGPAFQQALAAKGYVLARGNRRIVVVDPHGKAINPARQLIGVKAAQIAERLAGLDAARLPKVEEVRQWQAAAQTRQAEARRTAGKEETFDREGYNARWEQGVVDAAIAKEQTREARARFGRAAGGRTERSGGGRTRRAPERIRGGRMDSAREHFREAGADRGEANDNSRRAALQSRHLDQQIEFDRAQDHRRFANEERLAEYYSATTHREELAALEARKRPSRADLAHMDDLRLSIADADRRAAEHRQAFRLQQEREREKLFAQQAREREVLERELAGQTPPRAAERPRDWDADREPSQGPPQGRERSR